MSIFMKLAGIVLAILGAVLAALTFYKPGTMDVYGIKLDTAALLFVGGILALGLGGIIDALGIRAKKFRASDSLVPEHAVDAPTETSASPIAFGRKPNEIAAKASAVTTVGAAMAATSSKSSDLAKTSVADTIAALDQAKSDIRTALGGMESMTSPAEEIRPMAIPPRAQPPMAQTPVVVKPVAALIVEPESEEMDDDTELFVVEEKIIRGRPARILSDDTVEAETDEGWMRFENLEHLNEYIDSTEETEA